MIAELESHREDVAELCRRFGISSAMSRASGSDRARRSSLLTTSSSPVRTAAIASRPADRAYLRSRVLVLDDVQLLFSEPTDVLKHPLQYLGGVTLPVLHLIDDAHRVSSSV